MKTIRKHWQVAAITALFIVITGSLLVRNAGTATAMMLQAPPYTDLSEQEHDAIMKLLSDLSLSSPALIALNVDAQQAENVISTVRTWYENNTNTLGTKQADIDDARATVRSLRKSIVMGPFQEGQDGQLATAVSDLRTAEAAYDTALNPLRTSVDQELSQSQRDTWDIIESGYGQDMPLAMLSLTDQQRLDVNQAWRVYRSQLAAAESAEDRAAAVSTWEAALANILTDTQETIVSSYESNYATASDNVVAAIELVLPVDTGV